MFFSGILNYGTIHVFNISETPITEFKGDADSPNPNPQEIIMYSTHKEQKSCRGQRCFDTDPNLGTQAPTI